MQHGDADMEKDRPDTVSKFQYWNYLEDILDGIQEGVYITDSEANTIYLNHSYELITGLLKTEMLGKNMRELVDSGAVSASGTLMVLDSGERVTMEQSLVRCIVRCMVWRTVRWKV